MNQHDDQEFDLSDADIKVIRHIDDGSNRTLSSKDQERRSLLQDVENFLRTGGQVEQVQANVTADPPRKPVSNYGSRPI